MPDSKHVSLSGISADVFPSRLPSNDQAHGRFFASFLVILFFTEFSGEVFKGSFKAQL